MHKDKKTPPEPKKVNPYDLGSLYDNDKFRPPSKWKDWTDKPSPYDVNRKR